MQLNRYVMGTVFFIPLCVIALFESQLNPSTHGWVKDWFSSSDDGGEDAPHFQDPVVMGEDAERGLRISKVLFSEIVKQFPDTTHVRLSSVWMCFDILTIWCAVDRGGDAKGVQGSPQ